MDYIKTGRLIAEARNEKGLTQRELARTLHISNTTVSKWERGVGFPDVSIIEPLADALGLAVAELFRGERGEDKPSRECESLLADAVRASRAELAWKRRRYLLIASAIALAAALIALAVVLFPPALSLHGTYQSELLSTNGYCVTVTADARAGSFVEYIDSREVDRGSFTSNGDGTYTFIGSYSDGSPRPFLVRPVRGNSFSVLVPGIMGAIAIELKNVSDVPGYIGGYDYDENLAAYGDNDEYRKLLDW